jgi:N-acetylmuramoyl-L-alanine amidase
LRTAGFSIPLEESGSFLSGTAVAIRQFQRSRGLHCDGVCDERTWAALVEAGRTIGERPLWHTLPHQRGDDVAELQRGLALLGFDCGRIDGIFGPDTERALVDFQRNSGLVTDGICGLATLKVLTRLSRQTGAGPGVAMLREQEAARSSNARGLRDTRVVIGHYGGLSAVVRPIAQQLRATGCLVVPVDEPDPFVQSAAANAFEAHVYMGLEVAPERPKVSFYSVPAYESVGGRALAFRCVTALENRQLFPGVHLVGERLSALRETKMPAVMCSLGPIRHVLDQAPRVAAALTDALAGWLAGGLD